jgi:transposase, IS5 family
MKEVDQLLEDAALVESVYDAQGKRHPKSRTHGRTQTPAEVALRLLILKHVRNWSYDTLEREVRANLVYRAFTRMGDEKVPDAKTLARLGQAIGPEVIREWHERLMELARERGVVKGRKMRGRHHGRCCDIVLYLAISVKTLIAALRCSGFAELALDS